MATRDDIVPQQQHPPPKLDLTPVEETLLMTLYFRARDAGSAEPVLGDVHAGRVLSRVNIDLSRPAFPRDPRWARLWCTRARACDDWCGEFLAAHRGGGGGGEEDVTVLHLGCGVDGRAQRLADAHRRTGPGIRWVDVDRPAVISLRERLVPAPPGDYRMVAADVAGDNGWLESVPDDRPTLVVMEGLVMYLTPEEGARLLRRVVDRFPRGQLVFDVVGSLAAKMLRWDRMPPLRGSGVRWTWWCDDPRELERVHPRMRYLGEAKYPDDYPPWFGETLTKMLSWLPSFKNLGRVTRFEFGPTDSLGDDLDSGRHASVQAQGV